MSSQNDSILKCNFCDDPVGDNFYRDECNNKYNETCYDCGIEQEDDNIVFHCASCSRPIIRDSLDHNYATSDYNGNYFCVNCPQKTCDDCVLGHIEGYDKCVLCDGYFAEDDDYSENIKEEDASCHLCGSNQQLVQMKSTGEIICQNACDEEEPSIDEFWEDVRSGWFGFEVTCSHPFFPSYKRWIQQHHLKKKNLYFKNNLYEEYWDEILQEKYPLLNDELLEAYKLYCKQKNECQ